MPPERRGAQPRTSTFSIVASDPQNGACGVAIQSKFLAIGALSAWAEPGVGAIATQALINVRYGAEGLALLRAGRAPEEVVARLTLADHGRADRQLGVVDVNGRSASYTGERCAAWAGGRAMPGCAVQGNLLVSDATTVALWDTFAATADRPLGERLLAALAAGQAAGGDRRGQQSAALKVVQPAAGYGHGGVVVDLRVDDHPTPIAEFARLHELHRRYFGSTPAEKWLPVRGALAAEVRECLDRLGQRTGNLADDLMAWAAIENLEERVDGADCVDPVVLDHLRRMVGVAHLAR